MKHKKLEISKTLTKAYLLGQKILDEIYNVGFGRPLVLLVVRLGTTKSIFEKFSLPRFRKNTVIHLGKLEQITEKAIIRDWIHAISEHTHG